MHHAAMLEALAEREGKSVDGCLCLAGKHCSLKAWDISGKGIFRADGWQKPRSKTWIDSKRAIGNGRELVVLIVITDKTGLGCSIQRCYGCQWNKFAIGGHG
jgi:hypothetical protein